MVGHFQIRSHCFILDDRLNGHLSPVSVEEIQAILRVANRHQIPLWVCSQGKNFGYSVRVET